MKVIYDPNSLCHYGVLGMKWGRRKSKTSNKKNSRSSKSKKEKVLTDARKQKIKAVGKATARIAGAVAAASLLGYAGSIAFHEISNALSPNVDKVTPERSFLNEKPLSRDSTKDVIIDPSDNRWYGKDVNIIDPTSKRYGSGFTNERLNEKLAENAYTYDPIMGRQWTSDEQRSTYTDLDRVKRTRKFINDLYEDLPKKR